MTDGRATHMDTLLMVNEVLNGHMGIVTLYERVAALVLQDAFDEVWNQRNEMDRRALLKSMTVLDAARMESER